MLLFSQLSAAKWMFVFSQNLGIKALTPKVMIFGGGAFGGPQINESGSLSTGISALTERHETDDLSPLHVTIR